jgi:glutathione peroxidase
MSVNIYDFEVKDLEGKAVKLSEFKGKVLLIVNIASRCGQTPQLGGLEKLYQKYHDRGFEILAFPSNDFLRQQPEDGKAIEEFCQSRYGTTFRIFAKNKVRGANAQPLYQYLAEESGFVDFRNFPLWNFQKYIIDRNGRLAAWFNPWKKPDNDKIAETIEKCLNTGAVENKR